MDILFGEYIAVVTDDSICIYSVDSFTYIVSRQFSQLNDSKFVTCFLSPKHDNILVIIYRYTIQLLHLHTLEPIKHIDICETRDRFKIKGGGKNGITASTYLDEDNILVVMKNGSARIYNIFSEDSTFKVFPIDMHIDSVINGCNKSQLIVRVDSVRLHLLNYINGGEYEVKDNYLYDMYSNIYNCSKRYIVSASSFSTLSVWDVEKREVIVRPTYLSIKDLCFINDEQVVLVDSLSTNLAIYDMDKILNSASKQIELEDLYTNCFTTDNYIILYNRHSGDILYIHRDRLEIDTKHTVDRPISSITKLCSIDHKSHKQTIYQLLECYVPKVLVTLLIHYLVY